eukprot:6554975-Alexandrium_andersonii.AAC.1
MRSRARSKRERAVELPAIPWGIPSELPCRRSGEPGMCASSTRAHRPPTGTSRAFKHACC